MHQAPASRQKTPRNNMWSGTALHRSFLIFRPFKKCEMMEQCQVVTCTSGLLKERDENRPFNIIILFDSVIVTCRMLFSLILCIMTRRLPLPLILRL